MMSQNLLFIHRDSLVHDEVHQTSCTWGDALGYQLKMLCNDISAAMELMHEGISGIGHRIRKSACIVSYHTEVSPDYVVSRDQFIGLLGLTDELECLRSSPVMQIHDAYGKLRSEYGIGPGYCYALPSCSRLSSPYLPTPRYSQAGLICRPSLHIIYNNTIWPICWLILLACPWANLI